MWPHIKYSRLDCTHVSNFLKKENVLNLYIKPVPADFWSISLSLRLEGWIISNSLTKHIGCDLLTVFFSLVDIYWIVQSNAILGHLELILNVVLVLVHSSSRHNVVQVNCVIICPFFIYISWWRIFDINDTPNRSTARTNAVS